MCYYSFILVQLFKNKLPLLKLFFRAVVVVVHFTLFWSLFGLLFYVQMRFEDQNLLNNWMQLFTLIQLVNKESQYRASRAK